MTLKKVIKGAFNSVGLKVSKRNPAPNIFVYHDITVLLDVGANIGQYGLKAREEGFRGKIVSFEPLPDAYDALCKVAKSDPDWTVHPRCAIGATHGETEINIAKNSVSSSVLPMLSAHSTAAPESVYVGKAKTEIVPLDAVFNDYCKASDKVYLKIDTQGFEAQVLEGAKESLRKVFAVELEMSIVPLYDGQHLYRHFLDFFEQNGFDIWQIEQGFTDAKTGRVLQFDAVFVKRT